MGKHKKHHKHKHKKHHKHKHKKHHKHKHKKRSLLKRYQKDIPFILLALCILSYIIHIGFLFVASITLIWISFLIIKKINKVNLSSDLSCWGIRLLGILFITGGGWLLFIIYFKMIFSMSFIYDIKITLGLCLIFVGAFCEFRSLRRFPMIGIWQG